MNGTPSFRYSGALDAWRTLQSHLVPTVSMRRWFQNWTALCAALVVTSGCATQGDFVTTSTDLEAELEANYKELSEGGGPRSGPRLDPVNDDALETLTETELLDTLIDEDAGRSTNDKSREHPSAGGDQRDASKAAALPEGAAYEENDPLTHTMSGWADDDLESVAAGEVPSATEGKEDSEGDPSTNEGEGLQFDDEEDEDLSLESGRKSKDKRDLGVTLAAIDSAPPTAGDTEYREAYVEDPTEEYDTLASLLSEGATGVWSADNGPDPDNPAGTELALAEPDTDIVKLSEPFMPDLGADVQVAFDDQAVGAERSNDANVVVGIERTFGTRPLLAFNIDAIVPPPEPSLNKGKTALASQRHPRSVPIAHNASSRTEVGAGISNTRPTQVRSLARNAKPPLTTARPLLNNGPKNWSPSLQMIKVNQNYNEMLAAVSAPMLAPLGLEPPFSAAFSGTTTVDHHPKGPVQGVVRAGLPVERPKLLPVGLAYCGIIPERSAFKRRFA